MLVVVSAALSGRAETAPLRTWTSTSGATVEAAYDQLDGDRITLRTADGKRMAIGLGSLSEKDREYAVKQAKARGEYSAEGTGAVVDPGPEMLPYFADGWREGMNAVYESRLYRAMVGKEGRLHIYPLEEGEPTGPAIELRFSVIYRVGQRYIQRETTAFEPRPKPVEDLGQKTALGREAELTYSGHREDDVSFTWTIQFNPEGIHFKAEYDEPESQDPPSVASLSVDFPETYIPAKNTPLTEIKAATEGWQLVVENKEHTFWESMKYMPDVSKAVVRGPWRPRIINVEIPKERVRDGMSHRHFIVYSGNPAHSGFRLSKTVQERGGGDLDILVTFD